MSVIYLDTSALLKIYVQERGSGEIATWVDSAKIVATAIITYAEMAAALAKIKRMQWISSDEADAAWQKFVKEYPTLTNIEVTESIILLAGNLAWDYGLRGYDSVHLAAALYWQEQAGEDIQMVTFDKQLWEIAKKVGLKRLPEDIEKYRR